MNKLQLCNWHVLWLSAYRHSTGSPCYLRYAFLAGNQVRWQAKPDGAVAGVLTTHRVMIISQRMELLASCSSALDKGFPPFRSIIWAGPALFFTTATAVAMLGWDSEVRPVVTLDSPNSGRAQRATVPVATAKRNTVSLFRFRIRQ